MHSSRFQDDYQQSLGQSRLGNRQLMTSHIKSTAPLPEMEKKENKKYVYLHLENSLFGGNDPNLIQLREQLKSEFQQVMAYTKFNSKEELLNGQFNDNELHYVIVTDDNRAWAEHFAKQERDDSNNRKKIHVIGILTDDYYRKKTKDRSQTRIDKRLPYVHYFSKNNNAYPQKVVELITEHLEDRIRQEEEYMRTWALNNKYADKSIKRTTVTIYYDKTIEKKLADLYKTYKKKSRSAWLQVYPFSTFDSLVQSIQSREKSNKSDMKEVKNLTLRKTDGLFFKTQNSLTDPQASMLNGTSESSQNKKSVIASSLNNINRLTRSNENIILVANDNKELKNFQSFVSTQKDRNWRLWEIDPRDKDFNSELQDMLKEEARKNQQYDEDEVSRIIRSRNLIILAHVEDQNTRQLFESQSNIYCNMSLRNYSDCDEFKVMLKEGLKDDQDFVIAVAPAGSGDNQYETDYNNVIDEYRNTNNVENYFFLANSHGRHRLTISKFSQSQLSGFQGSMMKRDTGLGVSMMNLMRDDTFLGDIMRERDNFFHPFQGLQGRNVYLLVRKNNQQLIDGLRDHIASSNRLQLSTYIDAEYLAERLENISAKDSCIVITNDDCLREAQQVLMKFNEAFALNITDRTDTKKQLKVYASGTKQQIYQMIQLIPENEDVLQDEEYEEKTSDQWYQRNNQLVPKAKSFKPGDKVTLRLPADLEDIESQKMQIRLQKYFDKDIKIEYYRKPDDVRCVNKREEPLSFIICKAWDVEFMKRMAQLQVDELREEFILYYGGDPKQIRPEDRKSYKNTSLSDYRYLVIQPDLQRFKLVSSRWQRIEEYIKRSHKKFTDPDEREDSIDSNQNIRVFVNNKASQETIKVVNRRRNDDPLNAANKVFFYPVEDIETVIAEHSIRDIYYIESNDTGGLSKEEAFRLAEEHSLQDKPIKVVAAEPVTLANKRDPRISKILPNETEVGNWLARIKVNKVDVNRVIPHIIIDRNTVDWQHFLNKYRNLTSKFTYSYVNSPEELRKELEVCKRNRNGEPIWIMAKDGQGVVESAMEADKLKDQSVFYIIHGNYTQEDADLIGKRPVIFANENRQEVEAFILNAYRRDQQVIFPSAVKNKKVVLAVMPGKDGKTLPIRKNELNNWRDILKAKLVEVSTLAKLDEVIRDHPEHMIVVVAPTQQDRALSSPAYNKPNLKRVIIDPFYDTTARGSTIADSNKLYIATCGYDASEYLRYLRYNIRTPEHRIRKSYQSQLTEVYIQKDFRLSAKHRKYLEDKNDSVIINHPGFDHAELDQLLLKAHPEYSNVFVGDGKVGSKVANFNKANNTNYKFVNCRASPLVYQNSNYSSSASLQTKEADEYITYLFNLPERRYFRAKNYQGKFRLYLQKKMAESPDMANPLGELNKILKRNNRIELKYFKDLKELDNLRDPSVVIVDSQTEAQQMKQPRQNEMINYFVLADSQSPLDVTFSSTIKRLFYCRKKGEFESFLNNIPVEKYEDSPPPEIQPIAMQLGERQVNIPQVFKPYRSNPVKAQKFQLQLMPSYPQIPFVVAAPPPPPPPPKLQVRLKPIDITKQGLQKTTPSLKLPHPLASLPNLPLGLQIVEMIENIRPKKPLITKVLELQPEASPSNSWVNIASEPDLVRLPEALQSQPKFTGNLEMKRSRVSNLTGSQQLNQNQTVQQGNYTLVAQQVTHPSSYSIQQVTHHTSNQQVGSNVGYQTVSQQPIYTSTVSSSVASLNWENQNSFRMLKQSEKFLLVVPEELLAKYARLASPIVEVKSYSGEPMLADRLHNNKEFIIIVTNETNYPRLIRYPMISPRCALLVDGSKSLPESSQPDSRFSKSTIYHGTNGVEYLQRVLKSSNTPPQEIKMLYYRQQLEEPAMSVQYADYDKETYNDYHELYEKMLITYKRNRLNWQLQSDNGRPRLASLTPKVYLEDEPYMREFKNNFKEMGYLHEESIQPKHMVKMHEFSDIAEIYYSNAEELNELLSKQRTPSVVVVNASNLGALKVKAKYQHIHKFLAVTNNAERWIDINGMLPDVHKDNAVKRKQDMFTLMFNLSVFQNYPLMQYYYLSNMAPMNSEGSILFRTKEQLLDIYHKEPSQLMVVFVEARDIKETEKSGIMRTLYLQSNKLQGRVKFILIGMNFVDDANNLYVKFNEIDLVIKRINAVRNGGKVDILVFDIKEGERTRQSLIQAKELIGFENHPFESLNDIAIISNAIRGRYRKIYLICLPQDQPQLRKCFASNNIFGEFIHVPIDRNALLLPDSTRLNDILQYFNSNKRDMTNSHFNSRDYNENPLDSSHSDVVRIAKGTKTDHSTLYEFNGTIVLDDPRLKSFLDNPDLEIYIHQDFINHIPKGSLANCYYFDQAIPKPTGKGPRIFLGQQNVKQLAAEGSNTLQILITEDPIHRKLEGNTLAISPDDLGSLITRIAARKSSQIQGSRTVNLDSLRNYIDKDSPSSRTQDIRNSRIRKTPQVFSDFNKYRIIYDKQLDLAKKKDLLFMAEARPNIAISLYVDTIKMQNELMEKDTLNMMMMSEHSDMTEDLESQGYAVMGNKLKVIRPKELADTFMESIEEVDELLEVDRSSNSMIWDMKENQVDMYLWMYETVATDERSEILKRTKIMAKKTAGFSKQWLKRIFDQLNGNSIVVMSEARKQPEVQMAVQDYNVLVQSYLHSTNLQNGIRDRPDNMILTVIDRTMLDKIISMQKKYPHAVFILENESGEPIPDAYKPYIAAEIRKMDDLEALVGQIYSENENRRFDGSRMPRFNDKQTLLNYGNSQRLAMGLINTPNRRAFLLYRDPQNSHIKQKLAHRFANVRFVPYKDAADLKRIIGSYTGCTTMLIANGDQIADIESYIAKKRDNVYIIRMNPPNNLRDLPKVKNLFTTYRKIDLEDFLCNEFLKNYTEVNRSLSSKQKDNKVGSPKRYTQRYGPNTFGTAPRFTGDYVPTHSKDVSYNRKWIRSESQKNIKGEQIISPKKPVRRAEQEYYQI